MKPDVINV